jgi:hypothetical protein
VKAAFSATFREETDSMLLRIERVKAARQLEEKERKEALIKAQKEAEVKKKVATQGGIPPYDQKHSEYEEPSTLKRAQDIAAECEAVFASVKVIAESKDDEVKKIRVQHRMFINRRVGQVANSGTQVFSVIKELLQTALDTYKSKGADMLNYVGHTMATKFIEQAETQVSLHPPSAFPYGQVAADLIGSLPSFRRAIMTLMCQKCPYVVPRYPPRLPNQSEAEYKQSLGYKMLGDTFEDESTYTERMSGIIMLYAAMVQSKPLRPNVTNPYDAKYAWSWLEAILQMKPRPITPYLLAAFLEIAGYRFSQEFPKEFRAKMEFVQKQFIPMIPAESVASKTRLKIFIDRYLDSGHIDPPEGLRIEGLADKKKQ